MSPPETTFLDVFHLYCLAHKDRGFANPCEQASSDETRQGRWFQVETLMHAAFIF